MLALFCLRLALGMMACLLLLSPAQVNPRFYRTQFLTALGLACVVLVFVRESAPWPVLALLGAGMFLAFAGSFSWSLEGAPGGRVLIVLTAAALGGALTVYELTAADARAPLATRLVGDAASSALLGAALTAMLLGHFYLIAPGMAMTPLFRLLVALCVALALRLALDGFGLWAWSQGHAWRTLGNDLLLWLPVRWLVGFGLPAVLTWMVWQSAKIRSTQSATGIMYVVVIFCFLGELTGQLLRDSGLAL
jgi:hypothetical protein